MFVFSATLKNCYKLTVGAHALYGFCVGTSLGFKQAKVDIKEKQILHPFCFTMATSMQTGIPVGFFMGVVGIASPIIYPGILAALMAEKVIEHHNNIERGSK